MKLAGGNPSLGVAAGGSTSPLAGARLRPYFTTEGTDAGSYGWGGRAALPSLESAGGWAGGRARRGWRGWRGHGSAGGGPRSSGAHCKVVTAGRLALPPARCCARAQTNVHFCQPRQVVCCAPPVCQLTSTVQPLAVCSHNETWMPSGWKPLAVRACSAEAPLPAHCFRSRSPSLSPRPLLQPVRAPPLARAAVTCLLNAWSSHQGRGGEGKVRQLVGGPRWQAVRRLLSLLRHVVGKAGVYAQKEHRPRCPRFARTGRHGAGSLRSVSSHGCRPVLKRLNNLNRHSRKGAYSRLPQQLPTRARPWTRDPTCSSMWAHRLSYPIQELKTQHIIASCEVSGGESCRWRKGHWIFLDMFFTPAPTQLRKMVPLSRSGRTSNCTPKKSRRWRSVRTAERGGAGARAVRAGQAPCLPALFVGAHAAPGVCGPPTSPVPQPRGSGHPKRTGIGRERA